MRFPIVYKFFPKEKTRHDRIVSFEWNRYFLSLAFCFLIGTQHIASQQRDTFNRLFRIFQNKSDVALFWSDLRQVLRSDPQGIYPIPSQHAFRCLSQAWQLERKTGMSFKEVLRDCKVCMSVVYSFLTTNKHKTVAFLTFYRRLCRSEADRLLNNIKRSPPPETVQITAPIDRKRNGMPNWDAQAVP